MENIQQRIQQTAAQCRAWLTREEHRQRARELNEQLRQAFTEHPQATGETYVEHWWFTVRMGMRLFYTSTVLMIHGTFPFLLTKAASHQIEQIYKIMRERVPQARRDVIDDYQV